MTQEIKFDGKCSVHQESTDVYVIIMELESGRKFVFNHSFITEETADYYCSLIDHPTAPKEEKYWTEVHDV